MKVFKIEIMGSKWTYRVMSFEEFEKIYKGDYTKASGITDPEKRIIDFNENEIRMGVVRHEVRHAFTAECCLHSMALSSHQMEEHQAALDENRWPDLDKTCRKIYSKIKRYKKD